MALDKDFLSSTVAIKMLSLPPSGALQPLRHIQREDSIPSGHRSESGKRRFSSSRAKLVCWNWAGSCRRPHIGVEEGREEVWEIKIN